MKRLFYRTLATIGYVAYQIGAKRLLQLETRASAEQQIADAGYRVVNASDKDLQDFVYVLNNRGRMGSA